MIYKFNRTDYWGLGSIFIYLIVLFNTTALYKNSDFNDFLGIPFIALILSIIGSFAITYWYAKFRDKKDSTFILNGYKYNLKDLLTNDKLTEKNVPNIRKMSHDRYNEIINNYMISDDKLDVFSMELKNTILKKIKNYENSLDDLVHSNAFEKLPINNGKDFIYYYEIFNKKLLLETLISFNLINNEMRDNLGIQASDLNIEYIKNVISDEYNSDIKSYLEKYNEMREDLRKFVYWGDYYNNQNSSPCIVK